LPVTNESNVNVPFRLVGSTRRGSSWFGRTGSAARTSGGGGAERGSSSTIAALSAAAAAAPSEATPAKAPASASEYSIETGSPAASRASAAMRPPNRSFTHWSTNRLGARSLRLPCPGSADSGRIQVANCWGVSSRSNADRQAFQAAGVGVGADIESGPLAGRSCAWVSLGGLCVKNGRAPRRKHRTRAGRPRLGRF